MNNRWIVPWNKKLFLQNTSESDSSVSMGVFRRASRLEAYADEKLRQLTEAHEKKKKKKFVPFNCCRSTMVSGRRFSGLQLMMAGFKLRGFSVSISRILRCSDYITFETMYFAMGENCEKPDLALQIIQQRKFRWSHFFRGSVHTEILEDAYRVWLEYQWQKFILLIWNENDVTVKRVTKNVILLGSIPATVICHSRLVCSGELVLSWK